MAENWNETQKQEETETVIDLKILFHDFFAGCRKFWWLILTSVCLVCGATLLSSYFSYKPMYRSDATFTVMLNVGNQTVDNGYNYYYVSGIADQMQKTFPYILSSQILTDAIAKDLDVERINGSITATAIPNSNMVTMAVVSPDPKDAKRILESTIQVYPDVSRFVIGETRFNMVDWPELPKAPYNKPNYIKTSAVGAGIGLLLGLIFVLIYALLRKSVHNPEEIEQVMNLSCLATLPKVRMKAHKEQSASFPLVVQSRLNPWFSENMNALSVRVEDELDKRHQKVLLVTSTEEGEGKSVVAANIALKMSQHGKRVLLVDANLRKQDLAANLGVKIRYSINDFFTGRRNHVDSITPHGSRVQLGDKMVSMQNGSAADDEPAKIFFLGGSQPVENSSGILSGPMKTILEQLKEHVDYVVLDASASGLYEDALLMQDYADAILYVVMEEQASKNQILEGISSLDLNGNTVIGFVLNGVTTGSGGSYGYGYGKYGYGKYGYGKYSYGKYGYGKYGYGKYGYGLYGQEESSRKTDASDQA